MRSVAVFTAVLMLKLAYASYLLKGSRRNPREPLEEYNAAPAGQGERS